MTALAIDPGHTGAVALVSEGRLLTWAAWRKTRRRVEPYDVVSSAWRGGHASCLTHAVRVACVHLDPAADITGAVAVVEGIRQHGARTGTIALAESAGVAVAVLWGLVGEAHRPHYQTWTRDVLGCSMGAASGYSLAGWGWGPDPDAGSSRGASRYPHGRGVVDCPAPPAWAREHVADAAWMARWGEVHGKPCTP